MKPELGATPRFEVRSARNAEFFRSEHPWAAISVSSGDQFPVLAGENRGGLLRLTFEDVTEAGKPGSFTAALATEILDFVEIVWDKVEVILIHCEIGLSRSPAIAAALSRIYFGDDGQWLENYFANPLVYRLLVETHALRSAQGISP